MEQIVVYCLFVYFSFNDLSIRGFNSVKINKYKIYNIQALLI